MPTKHKMDVDRNFSEDNIETLVFISLDDDYHSSLFFTLSTPQESPFTILHTSLQFKPAVKRTEP